MVGVGPSYNSVQVGLSGVIPGGFLALPASASGSRIVNRITTTRMRWPAPFALRGGDLD